MILQSKFSINKSAWGKLAPAMTSYQTIWQWDMLKWTNPFLNLVFCFCPTEMESRTELNWTEYTFSSCGSSYSDAADMVQHHFSSLNASSSWRWGSLSDVTVLFCPAAQTKKEKNKKTVHTREHCHTVLSKIRERREREQILWFP